MNLGELSARVRALLEDGVDAKTEVVIVVRDGFDDPRCAGIPDDDEPHVRKVADCPKGYRPTVVVIPCQTGDDLRFEEE